MHLEHTVLSVISQTQKDPRCTISLKWGSYSGQMPRDRSRFTVTRDREERGGAAVQ